MIAPNNRHKEQTCILSLYITITCYHYISFTLTQRAGTTPAAPRAIGFIQITCQNKHVSHTHTRIAFYVYTYI